MLKTTVVDEYGLCILRDASAPCPEGGLGKEFKKAPVRQAALDGSLFFIDREDPTRLQLEVLIEEAPDKGRLAIFEPVGGRFLLRVPSGKLAVSGYEAWVTGASTSDSIAVAPGEYSVAAFSRDTPNIEAYDREMERLVGPDDLKFATRVSSYGAAGCLPLLITLLAGIFVSWQVGLVVLGAVAMGWLPYFGLLLTPRYRRVERIRKRFEADLPAFIVRLERVESTDGLSGGFVV